jgi:D-alanine-D-alanine ligase
MHGLHGEDGTIQGLLELANVPYTSTGVAGSALGMDKIMMKQFFRGADLPVLPGIGVTRTRYLSEPKSVFEEVEKELGYPVFVKPANLGSSIGVSRADDRESLEESLELAFEYDRRVLIEAGLDKPIELNCSVLGYDEEIEASPIEMPINQDEFLDFKDKYLASGGSKGMASLHRVLPAPIEDELRDEIQEMSRKIFRMLDCKVVVRIDYMFDKNAGKLYITEINTIPGSLAFYLWENAGVAYTRLIDRMVGYAEKAHGDKNRANYAYTSDILKGVSFGTKGAKGSKGAKIAK